MKKGILFYIFSIIVIFAIGIYIIYNNGVYEISNNMLYGQDDTRYNNEYLYEDGNLLVDYNEFKEGLLHNRNYQKYLLNFSSCESIYDKCFSADLELNHDNYISDEYVQTYLSINNYKNENKNVIIFIIVFIIFELSLIILQKYNYWIIPYPIIFCMLMAILYFWLSGMDKIYLIIIPLILTIIGSYITYTGPGDKKSKKKRKSRS